MTAFWQDSESLRNQLYDNGSKAISKNFGFFNPKVNPPIAGTIAVCSLGYCIFRKKS